MNQKLEMTKQDRIHYLDVLKGLLIIFVVVKHIYWYTTDVFGLSGVGSLWNVFNRAETYSFVSFYMPCFFVVTGLCSNFTKEFETFVKGNILTLVWPALVLTLVNQWFIWAMFFSKIIYWFLCKYLKNEKLKWIVVIALMFLGCVMHHTILGKGSGQWFLHHALGLCVFIHLGVCLKKIKIGKFLLGASFAFYVVLIFAIVKFEIHLPSIYVKYNVSVMEVPLHFVLATAGSLALLFVSKIIDKNRVLEYLGRNSLVIYLLHCSVMNLLLHIPLVKNNIGLNVMYWIILITTLVGSSLLAYVLNTKYLKWLLGKFGS